MQIKNFCNKLFICFLLMSLVTGCGAEEISDKTIFKEETEEVSDEKIEEEQPEEIETGKESVETEEEIQPEEEETDRGVKSPLAVYAAEQLGREIEGCHEADYDQDGENEVFFGVKIERTDEKELDKLEIYFVDDDYEITLVDTQEIGVPEDWQDGGEDVWDSVGTELGKYNARTVFQQGYIIAGSNGHFKFILYGCIEEDPIKLKESEGTCTMNHGVYLMTTYLYDGSISDVTDKEFLKICAGDFSGVVGNTENLIGNLEEWYTDKIATRRFRQFECDIDHDGTNELYMGTSGLSAVFHKGKEGIECWVYDSPLYLLDDGSFLHFWSDREKIGSSWISCDRSTIICFDSNGNQKIIDEYARVHIDNKITDWENSAIIKEFSIESSVVEKHLEEGGYLYFKNGNPIAEDKYFERLEDLCIW